MENQEIEPLEEKKEEGFVVEAIVTTKVCSKCGEEKGLECFGKDKHGKYGLKSYCKECKKKYDKEYISNNKEQKKKYDKEYYQKIKDKEEYKKYQIEKNKIKREITKSKIVITKICCDCKEEKDRKYFNVMKNGKLYYRCKECLERIKKENEEERKENQKKYIEKYLEDNKEILKEKRKIYYEKNRDIILIKNVEYNINNRDKRREYKNKQNVKNRRNELIRERRKNDICFDLRCIVSKYINENLKKNNGSKNGSSILKYLPYTIQELKDHLEKQFEPWMNWDNHGKYKEGGERKWHIDHIIPCSKLSFDSMEHPNFLKCWCLENLRPLDAKENIKKSNKLLFNIEEF